MAGAGADSRRPGHFRMKHDTGWLKRLRQPPRRDGVPGVRGGVRQTARHEVACGGPVGLARVFQPPIPGGGPCSFRPFPESCEFTPTNLA